MLKIIKELLLWRCQTYTGVFFRLGIGPGVSVNRCLIEKGSHSSVSWKKKKDSRWMNNHFTSLIIFMKSWQHETLVYIVNPHFHQSNHGTSQIDHNTGIYVHADCHVMAVGVPYGLFYVPFKLMYKDEGNKVNGLTLFLTDDPIIWTKTSFSSQLAWSSGGSLTGRLIPSTSRSTTTTTTTTTITFF